jgi:pimeloyl-ACP methyl ester carboxylesterase
MTKSVGSKEAMAAAWEKRNAELVVGSVTLADGRSMSYHIDGDRRKPAVLLLHGMLHSRLMWISETPPVECHYVAVDRPGYFGSSDPPAGYSYTDFAKDVEQLMHHLQVSTFAILGHSSGGPNALAIAAVLGPAKVSSVALLGSDTEYRHPSPNVPVDPFSKDVLISSRFAEKVQGAWVRATSHISGERGKNFFSILKHLIRIGFKINTKDLLRGDEVKSLWDAQGGNNFFRRSLEESAKTGISNTAGMAHDFAIERHQRWDFDVNMIRSQVIIFTGALDDLMLDASHFNHEEVVPASEMYVIPARGHLGILAEPTMSEIIGTILTRWRSPSVSHVPPFCLIDNATEEGSSDNESFGVSRGETIASWTTVNSNSSSISWMKRVSRRILRRRKSTGSDDERDNDDSSTGSLATSVSRHSLASNALRKVSRNFFRRKSPDSDDDDDDANDDHIADTSAHRSVRGRAKTTDQVEVYL